MKLSKDMLPLILVLSGAVICIFSLNYPFLAGVTCPLWLAAIGLGTYKTIKEEGDLDMKDKIAFLGIMFMISIGLILLFGYLIFWATKILFFVGMAIAASKMIRVAWGKMYGLLEDRITGLVIPFLIVFVCIGNYFLLFPESYSPSEFTAGWVLLSILGWLVFVAITIHLIFEKNQEEVKVVH